MIKNGKLASRHRIEKAIAGSHRLLCCDLRNSASESLLSLSHSLPFPSKHSVLSRSPFLSALQIVSATKQVHTHVRVLMNTFLIIVVGYASFRFRLCLCFAACLLLSDPSILCLFGHTQVPFLQGCTLYSLLKGFPSSPPPSCHDL